MARKKAPKRSRRLGAAAVLVAVVTPLIIAVAALTIDVGIMYNAKADLQRTADACALAAAGRLAEERNYDPITDGRDAARMTAAANPVLNRTMKLADEDITFGRAWLDVSTGQYEFRATHALPDAVRIVARKTKDSPNGALPLVFARIFGRKLTEVSAEAVAAIIPRDIALVMDLSGSMVFDSQFRYYREKTINLYDVWAALPGGSGEIDSTWLPHEEVLSGEQMAGPAWGFFKRLGFGDDPADKGSYNLNNDPGLIRLGKGSKWNDRELEQYLYDQGYSRDEVRALMTDPNSSDHVNRVAVALGLAEWNSGIRHGRWERLGLPIEGDGDQAVHGDEITWVERHLSRSMSDSEKIWRNFIKYQESGTFSHRYGIKTVMEYILQKHRAPSQTPELRHTPVQPLQATKDAGVALIDLLEGLNSSDQLSLEVYGQYGVHEVDLTPHFSPIRYRLLDLANDQYGPYTNIGAGLERAIEELTSSRARRGARKVIVLLTDGQANRDRNGRNSTTNAKNYAIEEARRAAGLGFTIITISVGQGADHGLMTAIANIGKGVHFHAEGSIDQYSSQLEEIFRIIGGKRTVELIR